MKLRRNFTLFCFALLLLLMLIFPEAALQGATAGLLLWWEKVLPALLPFFMLADIIMRLGGFEKIAKGMSPLCRRLFHLPGAAGAAIVLGFTSGFPTGAAICSSLLEQNSISKRQAEQLLCFTNNAGPLFILITVCTAILNMPQAGIFLLCIHYGISLIYGIISARFLPLPQAAEYAAAKTDTAPPLGILLKNAAQKAVMQIALIGCYLVFFSLLCSILDTVGFFALCGRIFAPIFQLFGLSAASAEAIFCGITEMTLGISKAVEGADFAHSFALCAFFLSFGGLSVQAQVYAMIAAHELDFKPYMLSCLIKGIAAYCIALPIGKSLSLTAASAIPIASDLATPQIFLLCLAILAIFYIKGKE